MGSIAIHVSAIHTNQNICTGIGIALAAQSNVVSVSLRPFPQNISEEKKTIHRYIGTLTANLKLELIVMNCKKTLILFLLIIII